MHLEAPSRAVSYSQETADPSARGRLGSVARPAVHSSEPNAARCSASFSMRASPLPWLTVLLRSRPPARAPLRPGGGEPGPCALADHGALELGEGAEHL